MAAITFDNNALCHGTPRPRRLQRVLTPVPVRAPAIIAPAVHSSNDKNNNSSSSSKLTFENEALCYGAPRPFRLQRVLTPTPGPIMSHKHSHKHSNKNNHVQTQNPRPRPAPHNHLHLPHINIHLPHLAHIPHLPHLPHLAHIPHLPHLLTRLHNTTTQIRTAFKEHQQATLRQWEEKTAVDEEVRRLFLEDQALWKDGRMVAW